MFINFNYISIDFRFNLESEEKKLLKINLFEHFTTY
jgi:hypothetical protein